VPLCGSPYALTPTVLCPAELDKGQMLHADSFHLGDSMSALEMMDPKMDAGVINAKNASVIPAGACPRGSLFACVRPSKCRARVPRSHGCCAPGLSAADECFDRGLVDLDPDIPTTLMSMDRLLALEMTWMRGTAMVQTLFTCLYCQRPAAIRNKTLKVYCQGVLKTCEVAKRAASRASVYEVTVAEVLSPVLPLPTGRSLTPATCDAGRGPEHQHLWLCTVRRHDRGASVCFAHCGGGGAAAAGEGLEGGCDGEHRGGREG
jgi:hypothetical protein